MSSPTPHRMDDAVSSATGAPARAVLVTLSLAMLLPALSASIVNVALPSLARAFEASVPAVQWVLIAYLLTITSLVVSAGRMGDLIGRRRLLLAGLAVFTLASALCATSGVDVGRMYERVEDVLGQAQTKAVLVKRAHKLHAQGQSVPGFNHPLYPKGDPRDRNSP